MADIVKAGGSIRVGGKTYLAPPGGSLSIINDRVYVNGTLVEPVDGPPEKIRGKVEIHVDAGATLSRLELPHADVVVHGNVGSLSAGGDVQVTDGFVVGSVSASGDVELTGDIGGNVSASGDVTARTIRGVVNAAGDVTYTGK